MWTLRASFKDHRSKWIVFGSLAAFATLWALYTQHVWEDYYITYRASKNLATGHGLTFTAGERVHSFTSPLGVLLPALASLLTANSSDTAALWIFRVFSISAYAGAGVFLWSTMRRLFTGSMWPAIVLVIAYGIEIKIVDNATNGMESGIVGLFLGWMVYACFVARHRQILQIGLAWAGLMWSRPDSFIYIGIFGIGLLLIPPDGSSWAIRKQWFKRLLLAGLVTTVVYLPWFGWATIYYGTPVPHTVTAKGLGPSTGHIDQLMSMVTGLPGQIQEQVIMFQTVFMPPYSHNTGWPESLQGFSYWTAMIGMFLWLVPGIRREARILSLTYFGGLAYLLSFVGFPIPWYLPTPTTLCLAAYCILGAQLLEHIRRRQRGIGSMALKSGLALITLGAMATISVVTVTGAYHLKWQQKIVERGNREPLGHWLAENSPTTESTVFLEPLGYIGFYSGLKMLDFPGLSSPEVVAARKEMDYAMGVGAWPALIERLRPTWLVLRTYERDEINRMEPEVLGVFYQLEKIFDVRNQVEQVPHLYGRGYLGNDAYYEVYRSIPENFPANQNGLWVKYSDLEILEVYESTSHVAGRKFGLHAPARISISIPVGARSLRGRFGIESGAMEHDTDGAGFIIRQISADNNTTELLNVILTPIQKEADRGHQYFEVEVDRSPSSKIELEITAGPHDSNAADWTYWSHLQFDLEIN